MLAQQRPVVSAGRELDSLDRRISVLETSDVIPGTPQDKTNRAELRQLKLLRGEWQNERDRVRRARIEHHRRLFRVHRELAAENYTAIIRLMQEENGRKA